MLSSWLPSLAERTLAERKVLVGTFFFERPQPERALIEALASGKHILLYGPARQGKTTLLNRLLQNRNNVVFYATAKPKFADISRMYLMSLGAVTVERKRKKTKGAKAEISWKWPFSAGVKFRRAARAS